MMTFVRNFVKEEEGQDLIEYSLLLAFIALASAPCSATPAPVSVRSGAGPARSSPTPLTKHQLRAGARGGRAPAQHRSR